MATTSPARIDDDLYASAKLAGEAQSRSASQQVAHWARIGREIEASAGISQRELAEVLAGARPYDSLNAREQAVVRAEWTARMTTRREALNLAARFSTTGRTWVELDDVGNVVERGPGESTTAPRVARKATKASKTTGGTATRKVAKGVASTKTVAKPTDGPPPKLVRKPSRPASGARSTA